MIWYHIYKLQSRGVSKETNSSFLYCCQKVCMAQLMENLPLNTPKLAIIALTNFPFQFKHFIHMLMAALTYFTETFIIDSENAQVRTFVKKTEDKLFGL